MTPVQVLQEAIALFDSASECARACDVSPQALNNALKRGRVSPELAAAIEKGCKPRDVEGRITRARLVWGSDGIAA